MGIVQRFKKGQNYQPGLSPGDKVLVEGQEAEITVINPDGTMSVDIPGDPVRSVTVGEGEWQPIEKQPEIPQNPSYPPEKVEQALASGDKLIGMHFDKLALMIEHNAGVAQELGQVHRKRFYGYFIDQVKAMKEQFEKELNPEGGYEPPPKPKNNFAQPKGLKPWHRYD